MLKRRLIPKLQLDLRKSFSGARPVLVITHKFGNRRAIGDPLSQAKIYEAQLADELILLDLARSEESWPILLTTLEAAASTLATPLAVGGGVNCFEQVQALLDLGADKVVLNTSALKKPQLIDRIAIAYGAQCVVVNMDARPHPEGGWRVWSDNGLVDAEREVLQWAREAVDRGAGEIMSTAIERDGTGKGLDLRLTAALSKSLPVPVVASGGCGLAQHFVEGYESGASAVAAGSFFSQRDQNPIQCRSHIRNAGIPIRAEH